MKKISWILVLAATVVGCDDVSDVSLYDWDVKVPFNSMHYKLEPGQDCPGMRVKAGISDGQLHDEQQDKTYYSVFLDGVGGISPQGDYLQHDNQMIVMRSHNCEIRVKFEIRSLVQ